MKYTYSLRLIYGFGTMFLLGACGAANSASNFVNSASTTPGADQSAGFALTAIPTNNMVTAMHIFNNYGQNCAASSGQAPTDTYCLLNARELDLNQEGMTTSVNVPQSMCAYVSETPYFYYNQEAGYGPTSVVINSTDGAVTSCTVEGNASGTNNISIVNGACSFPGGQFFGDGTFSCVYNHIDAATGASTNCCDGLYSLELVASTSDPSGGPPTVVTTSSSGNAYGGAIANCLAGQGLMGTWPLDPSGFPTEIITPVPAGGTVLTEQIVAPVNYLTHAPSNISVANFFSWSQYLQGVGVYANTALTPRPLPIYGGVSTTTVAQPGLSAEVVGLDRLGHQLRSGSEAYKVKCLDEASEDKQIIRLYINSWDTDEQFASYMSSNGASGYPVSPANAVKGIDCEVGIAVPGSGYCHDEKIWADITGTNYPNDDVNRSATNPVATPAAN